MYEDKKDLKKSSPRQQDMCRERHVQAAINAPQLDWLNDNMSGLIEMTICVEFHLDRMSTCPGNDVKLIHVSWVLFF